MHLLDAATTAPPAVCVEPSLRWRQPLVLPEMTTTKSQGQTGKKAASELGKPGANVEPNFLGFSQAKRLLALLIDPINRQQTLQIMPERIQRIGIVKRSASNFACRQIPLTAENARRGILSCFVTHYVWIYSPQ